MEYIKPVFALFAIGIGLISLYQYLGLLKGKPPGFKKLEPMRKLMGRSLGTGVHFSAYVIFPLVAGVILWMEYLEQMP